MLYQNKIIQEITFWKKSTLGLFILWSLIWQKWAYRQRRQYWFIINKQQFDYWYLDIFYLFLKLFFRSVRSTSWKSSASYNPVDFWISSSKNEIILQFNYRNKFDRNHIGFIFCKWFSHGFDRLIAHKLISFFQKYDNNSFLSGYVYQIICDVFECDFEEESLIVHFLDDCQVSRVQISHN